MLICSQNKCHFSNDILAFIHHPITIWWFGFELSLFLSVLPSSMSAEFSVSLRSLWLLQVLIYSWHQIFQKRVFRTQLALLDPIWVTSPPWTNHCGQGMEFTHYRLASGSGGVNCQKTCGLRVAEASPKQKPAEAVVQEGVMDVAAKIPLPPPNVGTYIYEMDYNGIWQLWLLEKSSFLSQNPTSL